MRYLRRNIPVVKLHCDLPVIGEVSRKPSQGRDQSEMGKRRWVKIMRNTMDIRCNSFHVSTKLCRLRTTFFSYDFVKLQSAKCKSLTDVVMEFARNSFAFVLWAAV